MTITAAELFRGHRGDAYSSREIDYLVTGTGGDATLDVTAAIAAAAFESPEEMTGTDGSVLLRNNATLNRIVREDMMVVTVQYGEIGASGSRTEKAVGTIEYNFSYQAPSERVFQSLETIGVYSSSATWSSSTFGGAIGVLRNADGTYDVEGVETAPGNTTNTWAYTVSSISLAYEAKVERLMGCVNSVPFRNRPAGSMRFVQCTSQQSSSGKASINFGFQYAENVTNLTVGAITVPSKDGHDYLWVYRDLKEKTPTGGLKMLLPSPQAAIVERVFRRENLNQLFT